MDIQMILMAVGGAVLLSLVTFMNKFNKGEKFELPKFIRTIIIGVVIGSIAGFQGMTITADNWQALVAGNAGAVAVIDQITIFAMKAIKRD